jgi:hypothetical protein
MNGVTVQHARWARWSRRKWGYVTAAALIGQALVIAILGQRGIATPSPIPFAMDIRVAPKAGPEMAGFPTDPAVFALPNWNGFSREGWLAFQHPEFKPTDWTEPPQWLALQTADLGNSLNDFLLSNTIAPLLVANMRAPSSPGPQSPRVEVPLQSASELLIEGELAEWTLATRVTLPSWRHTDLLTNTVVHVVVDRWGQTVTTALIASSGLALADEDAMRLVKEARFVPGTVRGPKAEYTSGNLVFRWHTQAPTNAAAPITLGLP